MNSYACQRSQNQSASAGTLIQNPPRTVIMLWAKTVFVIGFILGAAAGLPPVVFLCTLRRPAILLTLIRIGWCGAHDRQLINRLRTRRAAFPCPEFDAPSDAEAQPVKPFVPDQDKREDGVAHYAKDRI